MPVLTHILNNARKYRRCILADTGAHYQKIKHWIPEGEKKSFQERMADAIEDETAWCTENTFLYYKKEDARMSTGVALFGMDHVPELLSMFMGVFTAEDETTCLLRFQLHPGKDIAEYKNMLTVMSMKRAHSDPKHPLMIRVDDFRKKIVKMLDAR